MKQIDIYDFFQKELDPLFILISKIEKGETITINEYDVSLNHHNDYEISTSDIHEAKGTIETCYQFLKDKCNDNFF